MHKFYLFIAYIIIFEYRIELHKLIRLIINHRNKAFSIRT